MLLQFSAMNYRSIQSRVTISLASTTEKSIIDFGTWTANKRKILPVLALFGTNSEGKSDLVHALTLMKKMVSGRYSRLGNNESLPSAGDSEQPTTLEIIFYCQNIKYAYGYSFNKKKIIEEALSYWPNNREVRIFSREGESYKFGENIETQKCIASKTPTNRLYLSTSHEMNCTQSESAYHWFDKEMLELDDAGIQTLFLNLKKSKKLPTNSGVWIVDETKIGKQQFLMQDLIGAMQDQKRNTNCAQLILSTDDAALLDARLLRRDQIWFVEKSVKKRKESTEIYDLYSFPKRSGDNWQVEYLQGRYRNIPASEVMI